MSEPFEAGRLVRLIHSIQRRDGGPSCFGRYELHCADDTCPWREFCVDWPLVTSAPERGADPVSEPEDDIG